MPIAASLRRCRRNTCGGFGHTQRSLRRAPVSDTGEGDELGAYTHSTSHGRKGGIAYRTRVPGRRSSHSSQTLRAMPETGRRGTGSTAKQEPGRVMQECRTPQPAGNSRAVCSETCTHGSEGRGCKSTSNGNSPAPYPTVGIPCAGARLPQSPVPNRLELVYRHGRLEALG